MPFKYLIHALETPNRHPQVSKSGIIAREEGCLRCPVCVKTQCVYNVYKHRELNTSDMRDSLDFSCKNCFRCIQNCPKQLIHKSFSAEYEEMGRYPFTPEIITKTWEQATTGKVPVSGAGYHGPFTGPGFDSIWTDMSEIVRPTRDGIHGREYISTAVDLGKRPDHLSAEDMSLKTQYDFITIPLPILFQLTDIGQYGENTLRGWTAAARHLGTFFCLPQGHLLKMPPHLKGNLIVAMDNLWNPNQLEDLKFMEVSSPCQWEHLREVMLEDRFLILRVPLKMGFVDVVKRAYELGIRVFHIQGSFEGRFLDSDLYLKDGIRKIHLELLTMGIRDQVSVLASGGIAMAEHVAKAIICGADAVFVDTALQVALECRLCKRCEAQLRCPAEIQSASSIWVARRTINLMAAWHSQLLEILGAMGLRDIRRLRGEMGRAMLYEELEKETFVNLNKVLEEEEIEYN